MTDSTPFLVSTLPPSRAQQRAALAVAGALFAFFLATLPFAQAPLPRLEGVVPMVSMVMFLGDGISAVLLFGQFAVMRLRGLLVLAAGYLFTGLLVVGYALTFPGAFSEGGLLGANLQTAAWIFVFWHLGLPFAIAGYAWLAGADPERQQVRMDVPAAIATAAAIAFALAVLVAWLAITQRWLLPTVAVDAVRLNRQPGLLGAVVGLSAVALVLLWRRQRSVLDLWLLVVSFAWVLDAIFTYVTENRFTAAWYANRVVRIVAANVVLFALLSESMRLYARLASATLARRHEHERHAMTMEVIAAAIEHELRQPLGAIHANAEAASRWLDREPADVRPAREAVRDIAAETRRAADILHAVRQLFAQQDREKETLDPNDVVRATIDIARHERYPSMAGVQLKLAASLPQVKANRHQIQEVILNLVRNATEADAAALSISTAAIDGAIEITVTDSGTGIDERYADRIFEPFFTTKEGGMGMGLALCRSIVEQHGGTLTASRQEPRGSTFRVVLPCA